MMIRTQLQVYLLQNCDSKFHTISKISLRYLLYAFSIGVSLPICAIKLDARELKISGIYKLDCNNGDFGWVNEDGPPMNAKSIDKYRTQLTPESTKGYNEWWRVCKGVTDKRK